jgi:hypothetical protein
MMRKTAFDAIEVDIEDALGAGNLTQLKEWVESGQKFERTRYDLTSGDNKALVKAAGYGRFKVVKWLVEECGQTILPTSQEFTEHAHGWPHAPIPEDENAVEMAVVSQHYTIAKWLLRHPSNNLSDKAIEEMLKSVVGYGDGRLFKGFFGYAAERINVVDRDICIQVAMHGTFENFKWLVKDSGQVVDLMAENGLFVATAITATNRWSGEINLVAVAKWLVEESGYIVDCRNCEDWVDIYNTPFSTWSTVDQEYLLSVKRIQDAVGLENWFEVREGVRTATRTRRRI